MVAVAFGLGAAALIALVCILWMLASIHDLLAVLSGQVMKLDERAQKQYPLPVSKRLKV